jgi:hypothetical protein
LPTALRQKKLFRVSMQLPSGGYNLPSHVDHELDHVAKVSGDKTC